MIRAGDKRIWKPKYVTSDMEKHEDIDHFWYGAEVTVLEVYEVHAIGRQCKIKIVDAPKVNNPDAFKFWAWEEELEKVKR